MIGWNVADAKRKFIFIGLGFLSILILFSRARRTDRVTEWVDYSKLKSRYGLSGDTSSSFFGSGLIFRGGASLVRARMGPVLRNGKRRLSRQSLTDLRNDTLGFGKVYVINMRERSDKLDAMRLAASVTGFDFEVQHAINGSEVSPKALSKDFPNTPFHNGQIGCWRSHMEVARNIVKNKLASALVMEDDIDWDVSLQSQLEVFALGSQTLVDTPVKSSPLSPYGDGWDLLWLGHCAAGVDDDEPRRVLVKNDPTVPPPNRRVNFGDIPDMSSYDDSTRIIFKSKGSMCTYAYGLSYHGAQKLLKYMSTDMYGDPMDVGLHNMCYQAKRGFKCISAFPQIFGIHRAVGAANRDSDIVSEEGGDRDIGFSFNIARSTRLNLDALIDGRRDQVVSQWPADESNLTGPVEIELRIESALTELETSNPKASV